MTCLSCGWTASRTGSRLLAVVPLVMVAVRSQPNVVRTITNIVLGVVKEG